MEGSILLSSWGLFERSEAMITHSFVVGSCLNWGTITSIADLRIKIAD